MTRKMADHKIRSSTPEPEHSSSRTSDVPSNSADKVERPDREETSLEISDPKQQPGEDLDEYMARIVRIAPSHSEGLLRLMRFIIIFDTFDSAIARSATLLSAEETWECLMWLEKTTLVRAVWVNENSPPVEESPHFVAQIVPGREHWTAFRKALGISNVPSAAERIDLLRRSCKHMLWEGTCDRFYAHCLRKEFIRLAFTAGRMGGDLGPEKSVIDVLSYIKLIHPGIGSGTFDEKIAHIPAFVELVSKIDAN
jgi:hypothetical protein